MFFDRACFRHGNRITTGALEGHVRRSRRLLALLKTVCFKEASKILKRAVLAIFRYLLIEPLLTRRPRWLHAEVVSHAILASLRGAVMARGRRRRALGASKIDRTDRIHRSTSDSSESTGFIGATVRDR